MTEGRERLFSTLRWNKLYGKSFWPIILEIINKIEFSISIYLLVMSLAKNAGRLRSGSSGSGDSRAGRGGVSLDGDNGRLGAARLPIYTPEVQIDFLFKMSVDGGGGGCSGTVELKSTERSLTELASVAKRPQQLRHRGLRTPLARMFASKWERDASDSELSDSEHFLTRGQSPALSASF